MNADNSGVLHLLLSADKALWRDCVRYCKTTDTVVLLDDAVMGLTWPGNEHLSGFPCAVVASKPDVEARIGSPAGIGEGVARISDEAFVHLLESHPRCLSWR